MNYENWISYRYLTASKGRFLSFLNFISVSGVATGVMSLIVVTGVMTGFGNNLREKIIGTTPHIAVEKEVGLRDYRKLLKQLSQVEGVTGASPYIQGNVFLESQGQAMAQIIRGVDPETESQVTKIRTFLKKGDIKELSGQGVIIGSELARYFGFDLGDRVTVIAPGSGIAGKGWRYEMTVVGIFNTGMIDLDTNLMLVGLKQAQDIFDLPPDKVSGIGLRLNDPQDAEMVKQRIHEGLGYSFQVKTWIDVNRSLFEALFLEKWGLFIVLTLMVLIASFNIISTLIVTVTSKIHDIGILQSIGLTRGSIRRIFIKQGIFIGVKGTIWGLILGIAVSYVLRTYIRVPEQIYSIDHVPIELQLSDILCIVTAAMVISYLATIYPAARAAQLKPVEALRYE